MIKPEPGLVISYDYLWRYEQSQGKEAGRKTRPCVIILAVEGDNVIVAPITHHNPKNKETSLEIPQRVKEHLGLDAEKSWVILDEVNQFTWPGFDLRPIPKTKRYDYGFLPPRLFDQIKTGILDLILKRRAKIVDRD